jgi:orotate phosphoribosyltransferase-like protein
METGMHKNTHEPNYYHAEYLSRIIRTENLRKTLKDTRKVLEKLQFDAIAFRGMSGAMLAPTLALRMNKTLLMVRKGTENSHSTRPVEGDKAARRYVIVDDLVDSGCTVRAICDEVKTFAPYALCIGVVEVNYLHHGLRDVPGRCCCHDSHVCGICDRRAAEYSTKVPLTYPE